MHATEKLHTPNVASRHAPTRKLAACQTSNFTHTHETVSITAKADNPARQIQIYCINT